MFLYFQKKVTIDFLFSTTIYKLDLYN